MCVENEKTKSFASEQNEKIQIKMEIRKKKQNIVQQENQHNSHK